MNLNEKELIAKSKNDPDEFGKLYANYYEKILNFLKFKLQGDQKTAEDLASETFLKAYKNIKGFQWQGISFSSWIYRIATNTLIDYIRKTSKYSQSAINEEITKSNDNIEKQVMIDDTGYVIKSAIKELSQKEQTIINLKFYEGKSNKEIAKIVKLTESNVGTILFRSMKKLKKDLFKDQLTS